jgi:hypothetical protein
MFPSTNPHPARRALAAAASTVGENGDLVPLPKTNNRHPTGLIDLEGRECFTKLLTSGEQLDLCLNFEVHCLSPASTLSSGAQNWRKRVLRPCLSCFSDCFESDKAKFVAYYCKPIVMSKDFLKFKCHHKRGVAQSS